MSRLVFRILNAGKRRKVPPVQNPLLTESASSLAQKIRTKKLSSVDLVNGYVERIGEINPIVNCVVAERFEDARREAREADEEVENSDPERLAVEKPLLGVPFTTKDCIAVKGLVHSAGLYSRKDVIASEDSDVVALLRKAGAIPLGLTNVPELCMWWESVNAVHGRTSNPYDTTRTCGGSSGGEGCIQGSAGSAFGIGSDIGGSIRIPSIFNGVFGHRPSRLIVPHGGHFPPTTPTTDPFQGIGPMCRRAEDLLPILKVIAGPKAELLKLDEEVDVKKLRFFYQRTTYAGLMESPVDGEIRGLFDKATEYLHAEHGVKSVETGIREFRDGVMMWLCALQSPGAKFEDLFFDRSKSLWSEYLKLFRGTSKHTPMGLNAVALERVFPKYGSKTHSKYMGKLEELRKCMDELLGDDGVLLFPTHPTPALYHNESLFNPYNYNYTGIFNVLMLPSTHVPMGLNKDGHPIGIQVVANDRCDRLCLAVARELEKGPAGWVQP